MSMKEEAERSDATNRPQAMSAHNASKPRSHADLGFGLMRLPRKGVHIDIQQVSDMIDLFLAAGFTYFDTARIYPGSEKATKKALVQRHKRDEFEIATKLNTIIAPTAKLAKRQFQTSLQNLGLSWVDYYLLHSLMGANYKSYEKLGLWDYVQDLKREGKIRKFGFSFHGGSELLEQILQEHSDIDFVQLQINYADWENPRITSRANYEVARSFSVPIIVMEPVKGGALANPPKEIQQLMKDHNPHASYPSWALRFVAGLEGVQTVLSGMSNQEQVEDNVSCMKDFKYLSKAERDIITQACQIMGKTSDIPCTACGYCEGGCPKQIAIPAIFAARNKDLQEGHSKEARRAYEQAIKDGGRASECIACGQCEKACPQHIAIIKNLRECARAFDGTNN